MFSIVVVENGICDPEYFFDKMQMYELEVILDNLQLRHKQNWEQTRLLAYIIAQSNSTKKINITDVIKFSWDNAKDETIDIMTDEDKDRLKKKSDEIIKELNTKING